MDMKKQNLLDALTMALPYTWKALRAIRRTKRVPWRKCLNR